jgi:hypothetical protein
MSIDTAFQNLNVKEIPDQFRVGGIDKALLGIHGGIGNFPGRWSGQGFNLIWRPHSNGSDHFLQLNMTSEVIEFNSVGGPVPNRGLNEADIAIYAIRYLQQIHDANFPIPNGGGGLHVASGFWLSVPVTQETPIPTLVRCASIPHGTTILTQGSASEQNPPSIPQVGTVPFNIENNSPEQFPEMSLTSSSQFRTDPLPPAITQELVDNPNSLLINANAAAAQDGFTVTDSIAISVSNQPVSPGISEIPFLGPNAAVGDVSATFWLQQLVSSSGHSLLQLQYSQTVLLNFNGVSWPHVTVATLVKAA